MQPFYISCRRFFAFSLAKRFGCPPKHCTANDAPCNHHFQWWVFDKAFSIIEQDAGTHFDAALAEIFLRCRPKLESFYKGESTA